MLKERIGLFEKVFVASRHITRYQFKYSKQKEVYVELICINKHFYRVKIVEYYNGFAEPLETKHFHSNETAINYMADLMEKYSEKWKIRKFLNE